MTVTGPVPLPARICGHDPEADLVRDMLSRIGDKWTMLVVRELSGGTRRFSHLQRSIPGVSHRMLARTLRLLERDGLVSRVVHPEVPPRVEYTLTELGIELLRPITGIVEWVEAHADAMRDNRDRYDERGAATGVAAP